MLVGPINPALPVKSKLIDEYDAEAVAAGSFNGPAVELPRGIQNAKFSVEATVLDRTTGDETYTFKIQGRNSPSEEWVDIDGLSFTTISATSGSEEKPADSDAPGVTLRRWVRAVLTTAGTTPIATAKVWCHFQVPHGAGYEHTPEYLGG